VEAVRRQVREALEHYFAQVSLRPGSLFVLGGSTSEVLGERIGTHPSLEVAEAVLSVILPELKPRRIYLAVQGCEHINRALVVEEAVAERYGLEPVTVFPVPKAGGALASLAYWKFHKPVMVESLKAQAQGGFDIGGTLIGMHLKPVAVPVKVPVRRIGEAMLVAAKSRSKLVGGSRAVYSLEEARKLVFPSALAE
jgi:uncharacterized protein (TIGR01440 family)